MPVFSDPAVKAACGDASAVRQRLSACSGQSLSAVLCLVSMARHLRWMRPCGRACLVAVLLDALEKMQPLESAVVPCCAAGLGFLQEPTVCGLVCDFPGIGAWLASGLDHGVYLAVPPGSFGVPYLWFCERRSMGEPQLTSRADVPEA